MNTARAVSGERAANIASAADTVISWGVTPNAREATPEPPKGGGKMLAENNGMFVGDASRKEVYFTFDLGYEAGYTASVLDILKENNIKAIFFICGNYLQENELIGRMIAEGHTLGNHTDRHKDLPTLSTDAINKDIADVQIKFDAKYGAYPMKYFRPPQGRFNESVLKAANAQGMKTMLWSIAIVDWGRTPINAVECAVKIEKRLHNGAIILLHITNSGTPEMLKLLLPKITAKGYAFGNPTEL
jgi:peptidoglycan-N-acetylmuramic acid deacetylase